MNYNEMTSNMEELIVKIAALEKLVVSLKATVLQLEQRVSSIENIQA